MGVGLKQLKFNYGEKDTYIIHSQKICYVICNCNIANIDIVAFHLSKRLNNNLYYTLEKLIFSARTYKSFCPSLFSQSEEKFAKCSHEREEDKFCDSQIFHFYKNLVNAY